jgi:hypothetical protein
MDPTLQPIPWDKVSLIMALGTAVIAFLRGWVVPGPIYQQKVTECTRAIETANTAVSALDTLGRHLTGRR